MDGRRAIQQAATKSPWHIKPAASGAFELYDVYSGYDEVVCDATEEDARFLITFDPEGVRLLLDVVEAANEIVSPDYRTAAEPYAQGVRLDAMRDLMDALDRLSG